MFKKVLILFIFISLFVFTQCSGGLLEPAIEDSTFQGINKDSSEISEGKGNGREEDSSRIYGDLIICLRDVNGIPEYETIFGEHDAAYYPLPIKFDINTLQPAVENGVYQTFELTPEGDVILEDGYFVKEVEFGRLNVVRAPQSVINAALEEAISNLTQDGVTGYTTDASGRLVAIIGEEDWVVNFDAEEANTPEEYNDKTIDSPRENVAIYQELLSHQFNGWLHFLISNNLPRGENFTPEDFLRLAFGAIAAGADKTGMMTVDELAYMNNWLVDWSSNEALFSDEKERNYYDYTNFKYSRTETYEDKYVRKTTLNTDGTWEVIYEALLDVFDCSDPDDPVHWTDPAYLVQYGNVDENITGFAKAADDAIQVLEYIHESDLIVYSPYFTADGFIPPSTP